MISIIFWSIWRRLYGEGKFKKYLSRTIQTLIAMLVIERQLPQEHNWASALLVLAISTWIVLQYWSRAIGEIIDAGLNHNQTKESYGRWFRVPLDWVYDKLGLKKYVGFYDFWYSLIRYGIGAAPLLYYSWLAFLLMPFQYFIYLSCHKLYAKYPSMYKWPMLLNESKNLAEVIHGALFGGIICLI